MIARESSCHSLKIESLGQEHALGKPRPPASCLTKHSMPESRKHDPVTSQASKRGGGVGLVTPLCSDSYQIGRGQMLSSQKVTIVDCLWMAFLRPWKYPQTRKQEPPFLRFQIHKHRISKVLDAEFYRKHGDGISLNSRCESAILTFI